MVGMRKEKKCKNRWGDPGTLCRVNRGRIDAATTLGLDHTVQKESLR